MPKLTDIAVKTSAIGELSDDQSPGLYLITRASTSISWVLADFDVKVSMTTPSKHGPRNPSLELIGLLADPPVSGDVIRHRLRG